MNKVGIALTLLFLAQLALVGKLYLAPAGIQADSSSGQITRASVYHIDEVLIEDGHGSTVRLDLAGERWTLPQLGGLPADQAQVEQILQPLGEANTGWAVAHTLAARQRFQVAHYHFRRKITLLAQGEPIDTVFLGTSPGFRKVHARNDRDNAIYSISLNLFDLPTEAGRWLARDLLKVRAPLRISADGYVLDRNSGDWLLGSGEAPNPDELQALLQALENLQLEGVAGERLLDEADLILQVEGLSGTTTLELHRAGDSYYIRSSRYPLLFRISGYTFDLLTGINPFL